VIIALLRHLFESSIFAGVLLFAVACLRLRSASSRHALLLCAALKFGVPLVWLVAFGARLRALMPPSVIPVSNGFGRIMSPHVVNAHLQSSPVADMFLLSTWLTVAALILARWLRKLLAQTDISNTVPSNSLLALGRMKTAMGITRDVRLRASREDLEPRLCGLFHPMILLPETLSARLTPSELDAVMLHELAHVRRWDNLTRAMVHVLTCVFWFFPVIAWLERRIDAQCELACDELVLLCGARPSEYLDGILKVCQFYVLGSVAGSSHVSGSNLKQRIELIMSSRIQKSDFLSTGAFVGLLFSILTAAAIATGFSANTSSQTPSTAATTNVNRQQVTCLYGAEYPEGTVIKVGESQEQMCVNSHGHPLWINTSDQARKRSQNIVSLPEPAPSVCEPTAPNGKYCSCKGPESIVFSRNSTVLDSNHQVLTCGASGTWMRPTKTP
jgi:beta-lactamase regulating signal transducer with metallopeptidase domain